jgi:hypothetical protein
MYLRKANELLPTIYYESWKYWEYLVKYKKAGLYKRRVFIFHRS